MSSLTDLLATQTKLEARLKGSKTVPLIDSLIAQLESQRDAIRQGRKDRETVTLELKRAIDGFQKSISEDQKETYNAQAKHGKAISKRFKLDLTAATDATIFVGKKHLINNAIILNFVRQGHFDIAESFAREAKVEIDMTLLSHFETMYLITQSLEQDDLSEAIVWAAKNRQVLYERNSTLEFQLHKTQFMRIFQSAHVFECIDYARLNFPPFSDRHLKEIQQLMAMTAYHSSIATSPYANLFMAAAKDRMESVKASFVTEFTALLAMSPTSPLTTTIEAANLALPTLIKLSLLKLSKTQSQGSSSAVDLPLPKQYRFHSVFVCPVTKEVGGEAWMLGCGHVIGGEALQSLSKGTMKLKCPYCPAISEVREAVKLIF